MQKKDKIEIGITLILVIILLALIPRALKRPPLPPAALETNDSLAQPRVSAPSAGNFSKDLFLELEAQAKAMPFARDPFFPVSKDYSSELVLHGIAWDDVAPKAVINNEIVEKGGEIQGKTVLEIQKNKVLLSDGKGVVELKIYDEE